MVGVFMAEAGFTWVDGVLVLVAGLYAWQAYERGVVIVLGELCAWITAWIMGIWLYQPVTRFLVINLGLRASVIRPWVFLLTLLAVQILVFRLIQELAQRLPRHFFSKMTHLILGFIPALINGSFFTVYVALALAALPIWFPFKNELIASRIVSAVLSWLPIILLK